MNVLQNPEALKKKSDFIHFISYVNCPELFIKAVTSTALLSTKGIGVIFDNRSDMSLPSPMEVLDSAGLKGFQYEEFCFIRPDVPLTTAQVMNFMVSISSSLGKDFFTWIHSDGEVTCAPTFLVDEARSRVENNEKWGALFTQYDVFCAFNVQACLAAGEWDWLRFPFYFLDNDYYRRLREAGYPTIDIGGAEVLHHNDASNTIKNDWVRKQVNSITFPGCQRLFNLKWPEAEKTHS